MFTIVILAFLLLSNPASESDLLKHLRYLASDELKGRGNNDPEIQKAAQYIANQFKRYGLEPVGDQKAYFQTFEITVGHDLGPNTSLIFEAKGSRLQFELGREYLPLGFGAEVTVSAPLVFAGFGITAPEYNYDDYKEIDARGKIVLVFEHEPQEGSESSRFGPKELTHYATINSKVTNAKHHGAVGVILIPDVYNHPQEEPKPLSRTVQMENLGIPALQVDRKTAERILAQSGRDLALINRSLHSHLTPCSFDFDDTVVAISLDVAKVRRRIANVVGFIPGQTDRLIILGAHYDHLGLGDKSSLAPDQVGRIHNGADDNASGTAGLIQLAHDLMSSPPRHGLLFIAFAGEELGLLGSQHYIENPIFPLEKTVAMINMDMIGRSQGSLIIGGVGTAAEFKPILDNLKASALLEFKYSHTPRASSDHLNFALKKIPVLFFFSGLHGDYHKPSDDWEKIDVVRTHQVLQVVRGLVTKLDQLQQPLQYVDLGAELPVGEADALAPYFGRPAVSTRGSSSGRGYGPKFGSMPDMAWEQGGVRFADISAGSPAARAGLKGGDILVEFDGKKIDNLNDFTYVLRSKQPGDEVEVVVLRDGQPLRVKVRLEVR